MNSEDILALQDRINRIPLSRASPEIIIAPKPEIRLHQYMMSFQAEICILRMAYNDLAGRTISTPQRNPAGQVVMMPGILDMEHIVASVTNSGTEATVLAQQVIQNLDQESMREIQSLNTLIMQGHDIIVEGKPSSTIHDYIIENVPSATITLSLIRPVYEALKSEINLSGKVLSVQAIVGGIQKAFERLPEEEIYNVVSHLESEGSPLYMTRAKFNDAKSWYVSHILIDRYLGNISFYQESLEGLTALRFRTDSLPIVTFPPVVEMERIILRSTRVLDLIDMINDSTTSVDIPMVMIKQSPIKIVKVFDTISSMRNIRLEWFGESVLKKDNRMNVVLRMMAGKYHVVHYNAGKNYFVINVDRHLSIREVIHTLCSGLNMETITLPRSLNTTFSFTTNYIDFNRHVLAWLITNMPPEYKAINLHRYVFVNENVKPNAFRDHISIHIRLGPEKVYLTISKDETTSGTIIPGMDGNLVGFETRQRFLLIRINKAPNIHYARICVEIYRHLVAMYVTYFRQTVSTIIQKTGINPQADEPKLQPLHTRIPGLIETYAYQDPILYRYASNIVSAVLPVPIKKEDAQSWRDNGHAIIRLPTVVQNDPMIRISSSGEIWLRTPSPGRFTLAHKSIKDHESVEYIPVQSIPGKLGSVAVNVNDDMTLSWFPPNQSAIYVLGESDPLLNKPGRRGAVYNSVVTFMNPVTGAPNIERRGISTNVLGRLESILMKKVTPKDLSLYAHLCLGECWEQSVAEITTDIAEGNIEAMRHFRALEKAFSINIYFLMGDDVEPYLRKPPHALFYLHRPHNPVWECLIFHSLPFTPDIYSILVTGPRTSPQYLFKDDGYLDRQMAKSNVVRMVNPVESISMAQQTIEGPRLNIAGWKAIDQIVDGYGKCRGITYRKQGMEVTLTIGFAPVQDLPLGEPKIPSIGPDGVLAIVLEPELAEARESLEKLVMLPDPPSALGLWRQREKEARILRIITHLLWSLEPQRENLREWIDRTINISGPGIAYHLGTLRHKLPNIFGSRDHAWNYLGQVIPTMIDPVDNIINVPSQETKNALYLHLLSTPKIRWPISFPQLIQFSWDLRARKEEKVFLQEVDLIQYMIYSLVPLESSTIITSPTAYILRRGGKRYLVQMAKNMQQASSIATSWLDIHYNPGLLAPYDPEGPIVSLKRVGPDFLEELKEISYIIQHLGSEEAILLIIPL